MKKGISLIVLVITIIVIIILAGAVILSLGNTNVIANANNAVLEQNKANVQDAITLYLTSNMIQEVDGVQVYGKVELTAGELGAATGSAPKVKLPGAAAAVDLTWAMLGIDAPKAGTYSVTDSGTVTVAK